MSTITQSDYDGFKPSTSTLGINSTVCGSFIRYWMRHVTSRA